MAAKIAEQTRMMASKPNITPRTSGGIRSPRASMTRFPKAPHKKRLVIYSQKRADLRQPLSRTITPEVLHIPTEILSISGLACCGRFELDQCGPGANCFPMSATIRCDQAF
jgi:hypothetical protein